MTERLREQVLAELQASGFELRGHSLAVPDVIDKATTRLRHSPQRNAALQKARTFIENREDELIQFYASGDEVEPSRIDPAVIQVSSSLDADLFRFTSLHWSVPVSRGFGRRTRFLVWDRHNSKLIGLIALGDPVFNLAARDTVVGWNQDQRRERLYNVLDAFVLGAIEPYRQLIGGKLVAMCALTEEVIGALEQKYAGTTTVLHKRKKLSRPVLITTTSALGRSSIYNRLSFGGSLMFEPVGYTAGFGHFQFSDDVFKSLVEVAMTNPRYRGNNYGSGPNWKIRTIRLALQELKLPGDLLRHGIRRQVFVAPVAANWREYLLGQTDDIEPATRTLKEISDHYRGRWAVPRSLRLPEFRQWDRENMRLSPSAGLSFRPRLFTNP